RRALRKRMCRLLGIVESGRAVCLISAPGLPAVYFLFEGPPDFHHPCERGLGIVAGPLTVTRWRSTRGAVCQFPSDIIDLDPFKRGPYRAKKIAHFLPCWVLILLENFFRKVPPRYLPRSPFVAVRE